MGDVEGIADQVSHVDGLGLGSRAGVGLNARQIVILHGFADELHDARVGAAGSYHDARRMLDQVPQRVLERLLDLRWMTGVGWNEVLGSLP